MSALILKSANHLLRIFKVYVTLAILGALALIAIEIVIAKPLALLIPVLIIGFLLSNILIWAEVSERDFRDEQKKRAMGADRVEPPKLPESLMALVLPARLREPIIGDLAEEFRHLLRFGRRSAATWYFLSSSRIIFRVTVLSFTLRTAKIFIEDIVKRETHLP